MSKNKEVYRKWFFGQEGFAVGLNELRLLCRPAADTLNEAVRRCASLGTTLDFINEAWPKTSQDKLIVCLLSMLALLKPATSKLACCKTSFDGLAYRTESGTVFAWRKIKDGRFIFMVSPGPNLRIEYRSEMASLLNRARWSNAKYKTIPNELKTLTEDLLEIKTQLPVQTNQPTRIQTPPPTVEG